MREKIKISFLLLLSFIGLVFVSCELQEEAIHQHEHNSNLKLYEMKFEELMTNKKFVNSFSKLPKSKRSITNATFGRTVMEDEYGFTIANKPAKVFENNGETSYTFLITRDSTNTDSFENLVIQTDSSNTTKAVIIKYNLTSDILASDHGSSEFQATKEIKQIVYNNQTSTTGKELFEDPCTTIHTIICCQSWSGGAGSCHVAQEVCLTTNAGTQYLSVNSETICEESTGGDSPGDTGTSSNGVSTNGGGATTTTTSSNYDGSNTSIHGNGSNSVNTGPVAPEVEQIIIIKDPCTKVKSPFTKVPTLAQRNINLSTKTTESNEYGFFMLNNANSTTINPFTDLTGGSTGSVEFPTSPTPSDPILVLSHTHNSPSNSTYSVPSWEDLDQLSYYMQQYSNSIDPNIVFITITADGTRYAITINNMTNFKNFFYWGFKFDINNFDSNKLQIKNLNMATYYYGNPLSSPPTKPLIKENSTNPEQDLKHFLNMLQSNNAGVDVFEVNSNFTTFTKVVYNQNTNSINRKNCN